MNKIIIPEPENYITKLYKSIPKHIIFTFFVTIVLGYITHMLFITNLSPYHDNFYLWDLSGFDAANSGRPFLTPLATLFTGGFYSTFMHFTCGLLFIALTACYTVATLDIKCYTSCFLVGGLIAVFPSITSIAMYMVTFQAYMFSYFLAAAGVYATLKYKRGFLWTPILFAVSLGIYQSFITYSIGLYAMYFIFMCLNGAQNHKTILVAIIKGLVTVAAGYVLYLILLNLWLYYTHTTLLDYQGINTTGQINFMEGIKNAYNAFSQFFFKGYPKFSTHAHYIYIALTVLGAVMLFVIIFRIKLWKKETRFNFILLLFLIFTIPIWIAAIYVLTANGITKVRDLNIISYVLYPIFFIKLTEIFTTIVPAKILLRNMRSVACFAVLGLVLILSWRYYITDNQVYTRSLLMYDQTMAYANRLVYDIINTDGYNKEMTIVTYGIPGKELGGNPLGDTKIVTGSFSDAQGELTYLPRIINRLLDASFKFEDVRSLKNQTVLEKYPVLNNMPAYPSPGSIVITDDGKLLINFGE